MLGVLTSDWPYSPAMSGRRSSTAMKSTPEAIGLPGAAAHGATNVTMRAAAKTVGVDMDAAAQAVKQRWTIVAASVLLATRRLGRCGVRTAAGPTMSCDPRARRRTRSSAALEDGKIGGAATYELSSTLDPPHRSQSLARRIGAGFSDIPAT